MFTFDEFDQEVACVPSVVAKMMPWRHKAVLFGRVNRSPPRRPHGSVGIGDSERAGVLLQPIHELLGRDRWCWRTLLR